MQTLIQSLLSQPAELEKLYRKDPSAFKKSFLEIYDSIKSDAVAVCWYERLTYITISAEAQAESDNKIKKVLPFVILLSLLAGTIAKIPQYANLKYPLEEEFYAKNLSFIIFPFLAIYFAAKNKLSAKAWGILSFLFIGAATYINLVPKFSFADAAGVNATSNLSLIHLPLFCWSILGLAYTFNKEKTSSRLSYLRFNGDVIILTSIILTVGGMLTGLTIGLFELIGFDIAEFYLKYIVIYGASAAPIVATYILDLNPQLVSRVSPVVARVFSPLVLITLVAYLIALAFSKKDPFHDRDFLLFFNILLIGVLAIIFFAIVEGYSRNRGKLQRIVLFALSAVTIIVNGIALTAILFRIGNWGFTPNRVAVLGGNLLFLIHLVLISYWLMKSLNNSDNIEKVDNAIAKFLPVYAAWTVVVTFIFPLIFGFK